MLVKVYCTVNTKTKVPNLLFLQVQHGENVGPPADGAGSSGAHARRRQLEPRDQQEP